MITRTPTRHVSWGLAAILLLGACSAAPSSDETSVTQGLDGAPTSTTVAAAPDAPDTVAPDTVATDTVITAPTDTSGEPSTPATLVAHIDEVFPHDRGAFTQGLAMRDGLLYESTGVRGDSNVRIVEPQTGEVLSQVDLPDQYFGEGLEVVDDRIVQLTWTAGIAFIWDVKTLEPLGTYSYEGEGWGLCARDGMFYMSNGSSQLTVRDLDTFEALSTVDVTYLGEPVESLNELECIDSWVYANVWKSDEIVVIDPQSGVVVGRILTHMLIDAITDKVGIGVLNGIAYDASRDIYFLTGKYWPDMFQVQLVPTG